MFSSLLPCERQLNTYYVYLLIGLNYQFGCYELPCYLHSLVEEINIIITIIIIIIIILLLLGQTGKQGRRTVKSRESIPFSTFVHSFLEGKCHL